MVFLRNSTKETNKDAIVIHCKEKEIDLDAFTAKKNLEKQMQKEKEEQKKTTKSRQFDDTNTLVKSGSSFNSRQGDFPNNSASSSYCLPNDFVL
jgi:hypothetical protein